MDNDTDTNESTDNLNEIATTTGINPEVLRVLGFGRQKAESKPKGKTLYRPRYSYDGGPRTLPPGALRINQLRILGVLAECEATSVSSAVTLDSICRRLSVGTQTIYQGLGSVRPEKRESHDRTFGYQSLLTRGMVIMIRDEYENRYYLSSLGEYAIEEHSEDIRLAMNTPSPNGKKGEKIKNKRGKRVVKKVIITNESNDIS